MSDLIDRGMIKKLEDRIGAISNIFNISSFVGVLASSNGINDNNAFIEWVSKYDKIYIPKEVTLKLGHTQAASFININRPIEIYGGGTIEFIGDFSKTKLFRITSDNVTIRDIHFINNTGIFPSDVFAFVELYDVKNSKILNCHFTHGIVFNFKGENNKVLNSVFLDGIVAARGGKYHTIGDNYFDNIPGVPARNKTPIVVQSYADNMAEGYIIENNIIKNAEWAGITLFKHNKNSFIRNNKIYVVPSENEAFGISLSGVENVKCYDNLIINQDQPLTYAGIEVVDCIETLVIGNKISGFKYGIINNGVSKEMVAFNRNNSIVNNFIENFTQDGIRVFRSTSGTIVHNNIIVYETTIETSNNVHGIYVDADGFTTNKNHSVKGNKLFLKKTVSDNYYVQGIYIASLNSNCSENTIEISALDKVRGIRCLFSTNTSYSYGKNNEFSSNIITISDVVMNANCFGMQFFGVTGSSIFNNSIVKFNKIIAPLLLEVNKIKVEAIGNSIVDENFL